MRLTIRHTYAADTGRVHAVLVDPAFLEHASRELGATDIRVSATGDEASVTASVPTPEAVRGFLGPRMAVCQEYVWDAAGADGGRTGTMMLTVRGAPMLVNGVATLRPVAAGTEFTLDADLSVSVPLLGRTLETATVPEVRELLESQARLGDAWLTRA